MDEIGKEHRTGNRNNNGNDIRKKNHLSHSKSFQFPSSTNINVEDMQASRLQEIFRVANGNRSFSHKLDYEEAKLYSFEKSEEEIKVMIREKFDKSKEEVNVELDRFTSDLVNKLKNTAKCHIDWKNDLENLLLISQQCAKMPAKEFWFKCEGIVRNLDNRRQELPLGTVKQSHTCLLFILTRCTRLVQVHKEN